MKLHNRTGRKYLAIGTLTGSTLVSFVALSSAMNVAASPLNPCPGIYYEEPFNSTRIVPQGCPPNAATQQSLQPEAQFPGSSSERAIPYGGTAPLQPPLPESQANPLTTVALTNGSFDVRVTNNTNTIVTYEVIGHTQRRYLPAGETANLQSIPAPASISFVRQDNGFVQAIPVPTPQAGLLSISLDEDSSPLDNNGGGLRIQSNGQVFAN